MKKETKIKSKFQREIEEQQKMLEELYLKVMKSRAHSKKIEVPEGFRRLVNS